MAEEEKYRCKKCGAEFEARVGEADLNCSECGSDEIERFVGALYARDRKFVQELADAAPTGRKDAVNNNNQAKK
jgi:putative FmdB family regulatory protein